MAQDLGNDKKVVDIEFIDPNELITFVSDNEELEMGDEDINSEAESEEYVAEPELKYADILRDSSNDYIKKRQEDTRGKLAVLYTIFTFLIFLIIIVVAVIDGLIRKVSIIDNLNTLLPLVSGIFLGTLGFVLGYYFRKENNDNRNE